jgi:hypothetical protein
MSPSRRLPPKLRVIEGGLPPEKQWTEEELRRLLQPAIKTLPFVKQRKDAQPQWHPESYWSVERTSRYWKENDALGRRYAIAAFAAMQADGCNILGSIFQDMVRSEVERMAPRKGRRQSSGARTVMSGFLRQIGKMCAPNINAELACSLSSKIFLAQDIEECIQKLKPSGKRELLRMQREMIRDLQHLHAWVAGENNKAP